MSTETERTTGRTASDGRTLPPLSALDRLALGLGTRLILWDEQHRLRRSARADHAELAAQARADAEQAAQRTFEHRTWAGPRW